MIIAGIIFSVVAVFLGVVTRLPQGGGGVVNNLIAMSFLISPPPMVPIPPPQARIFDLEAAIRESQLYYMRNPVVTGNVTQGPMPRPFRIPRAAADSSNATAPDARFTSPPFSLAAFPLALHFFEFWWAFGEAMGIIAMVFITLCMPWLVIKNMHLRDKTGTEQKVATKLIGADFAGQLSQIKPHDPLFHELQMALSERDQALIELRIFEKQAKEDDNRAAERDIENNDTLKALRTERDDALVEVARGRDNLDKLQSKWEEEAEELKKGRTSQEKAWQDKEKNWEEKKAEGKKRSQEDIDSLMMGREREMESWRKQVHGLEAEKKGMREALEAKSKNILERMKKEREGWTKEKEGWKKEEAARIAEKEKMEAEQKELEEKRAEEEKLWEEENECARRRIVELEEEESERLKAEAAEKEKRGKELEAARKAAEEENRCDQKRDEEEAQKATRKVVSGLEERVLNGRKLIEDLQSDKRRDRQLLLELRAQLVRPTHAAPPTHINPLRFGGSSQAEIRAPTIAPISAPRPSTIPPVSALRESPAGQANHDVHKPIVIFPRPVVRLPPPPPPSRGQTTPAQGPRFPLPNPPEGPRMWTPDAFGGA